MADGRFSRRDVLAGIGGGVLAGCQGRTGSSDPRIRVPDAALRDERIAIRITGLRPETPVTVRARARLDGVWESSATFETDDRGSVELTQRAPISGSYEGVDGMGLIWSMEPLDGDGAASAPETAATETSGTKRAYDVSLEAVVDGERVATATTTRRLVAAGVERTAVSADDLVGSFYRPSADEPRPGVVLLHGSRGRPLVDRAGLFASRGYAALALQYFGPPASVPDSLGSVPVSYFERSVSWLRERPSVSDGPVGVVGVSRGSEAAFMLGAGDERVGAVVAYAPSLYRWGGWVADGEALPSLSMHGTYEVTESGRRYAPRYRAGVERASERRLSRAAIPVESIDGPLLLISGADDGLWPSTLFARHAMDRLDDADFPHRHEHLAYEDAGHSVRVPYAPTTDDGGARDYGGTPAGDARAAADSWPRVLECFGERLA